MRPAEFSGQLRSGSRGSHFEPVWTNILVWVSLGSDLVRISRDQGPIQVGPVSLSISPVSVAHEATPSQTLGDSCGLSKSQKMACPHLKVNFVALR